MFVAGRHFKMTSVSAWLHARCSCWIIQDSKNRRSTEETLYKFSALFDSYTKLTDVRQHPNSQIPFVLCVHPRGNWFYSRLQVTSHHYNDICYCSFIMKLQATVGMDLLTFRTVGFCAKNWTGLMLHHSRLCENSFSLDRSTADNARMYYIRMCSFIYM
jgi:hypothetical protein